MEWQVSKTLSKENKFWWKYDEDGLSIKRYFNNNNKPKYTVFSLVDLKDIIEFIASKNEVDLANSVIRMRNGTEKDGIGRYIYDNIYHNTTDAQASSQLVAILYQLGIIHYNQKKRNMMFRIKDIDWQSRFEDYIKDK